MKRQYWLTIVVLALWGLGAAAPAVAASAEEFYKGRTMTMVTLFGPGGATDLAGRLVGKYWPEATGGKYVVKNMPGAGGLVGLNSMAATGRRDGLQFAFSMFGEAFLLPALMRNPAARFDASRFHYVAGGFIEPWVLLANAKFQTLEELQALERPRYGCMSPYGSNNFTALPVFELLLPGVRVVTGYQKQPDVDLAVGKGELDFAVVPLGNALREIGQIDLKPLLVFWPERIAMLPDVPTFLESVDMTPEQRAMYDDALKLGCAFRVFAMMEDEPADRVAYVRRTLDAITARPDFEADARAILPMGAAMLRGKELDRFIADCFAIDWEKSKLILDKYLP